ncbi:MAG TPA: Gfo/Idh/MocA family oxidoreductase [Clostridia bacterium]|jgi:predicted dehydrogenase|nr:Gfo/Idh/MocA family oxidoreductase [Clostridia bacterium]HPZ53098.1 Gfo/Idh/MocA family oxidoreductase [Clostridia bacterium]
MLNIALIGTWHVHFDQYAREIKENPNTKIHGIWDPDYSKAEEKAKEYGTFAFDNLDDALLSSDVDGIVISTATNMHTGIIIKAAENKKHVFTEKVLCFTVEEAERIMESVKRNNIKFCISYPWRTRSDFLWIKEALDNKLVGDVTYLRIRNCHDGASTGWLPPHFFDLKECGGGAMMDLGAHPMYLIRWLLGRPKSITSTFTKVTGKEVEDNAVSVLEYENGAIAVSETGFVSSHNPFSFEASGTKGTIYAGGFSNKCVYNIGEGWIEPKLKEPLPIPTTLWVNGIIDNMDIPFDIDSAYDLTELMDYAYKSYESGTKVDLY